MDTDVSGDMTSPYILNHASAALGAIKNVSVTSIPDWSIHWQKFRDAIYKCAFSHMAKGRHRPNCQAMDRHPGPGEAWT